MPRPAVVIGLGGTGQWVLTWLKRDLLLSNNGKMPNNVKLLEIDTATKLEAGTTRVTATGVREESIQVGDVSLEAGEFVYLGGEARQLAQRIKEKNYPQIDRWFRAERWLNDLPTTSFTLDDGAGRLRQFGRLAIFKDVLNEETGSIIWRALKTAISSVLSATDEQRKLEIIVVGSFAGGTGSGLFIDVALLLRIMAQQLQAHHILRGLFALPQVFTTSPDDEMLARSFAAWRELNRFMVINPDFPMPLIRYVEKSATFKINPTQRLFDACYLVDGRRGEQTMAAEARYGAFPAMAEAVSAILDEEAGTKYTQWIFTNLAPEYSKRPDVPMYSALGAYSLQVPAYFVESQSTHLYAQQILLKLLTPAVEPDENGHLVARGANRHLALAAPDKNMEDKGFAGRTRSRRLFTERIVYHGDQVAPVTLFFGRIAQLLEEAISSQRRQSQVDMLARAGAADGKQAASRESWLTSYPNFGDDPKLAELRKRVGDHINYGIIRSFGRREGQKEEEARAQLRKIPNDMREKFGGMTASGQEAEEFYGTFGEILDECHSTQMLFFRQVLRVNLLKILMGESEKPLVARSGKLGYACDYFDGAVSELADFLKLMEDVRRRREEMKPELKLMGLSENAKKYLNMTTGKKLFWLWEHPEVKGAEDAYLQAQQRTLDLRREDILHTYVVRTAREMQELCMDVRDSLQRWIWHLATGDDASNLPGLWDEVQKSMQVVKSAHSFDTSIPKVQGLVADSELRTSDEEVAQALRYWNWDVQIDKDTGSVKIDACIELPDSTTGKFADPGSIFDTTGLPLELVKDNQATLLDLARREFVGFAKRTTVAEALRKKYPNPADLVDQIGEKAEPLFAGEGGARKKSNLIRVQVAPNDPYFVGQDGVEGLLRSKVSLVKDRRDDTYSIEIVGSENPYKFTMVRTDDLYAYHQFSAWRECQDAYGRHFSDDGNWLDPALMQIFPAEASAVAYERLEYKKKFKYEALHARVVMFLEDITALQQFLYLFGLGKITDDVQLDADTYRWELQWNNGEQIWLTPGWVSTRDQAVRAKPDFLNAVHGFVITKSNQSPYNKRPIEPGDVQKYIDAEMKKLGGLDVEIDFLKHMASTDGIYGFMARQSGLNVESYASEDELENALGAARKDYGDLARVTKMLFSERIKMLEEKLKGGQRFKPFVPKTSG